MRPIATDVGLWSVCLSVIWAQRRVLQKRTIKVPFGM